MIPFPPAKRGSTYKHRLKFNGTSGSIADCKIRLMVKKLLSDPDSAALASIDNDEVGGISIVAATTPYEIDVEISDTVMATLPAGTLCVGVQIELPDGTTEEIESLSPHFPVAPDAVRRVAAP